MKMCVSAEQLRAKAGLGESDYDFYRCYECRKLITRIEEIKMFTCGTDEYGVVCKCGSRKYTPVNLPWWGWLLPKVWKFAFYRIRGMV